MSYLLADSVKNLFNLYKLSPEDLARDMINASKNPESINESEVNSWKKSLHLFIVFLGENGFSNLYLIAEYSLTGSFRMDAILLGYTHTKEMLAIVVELKQWSSIEESKKNVKEEVCISIAGKNEYRLHPIRQTLNYVEQLEFHHDKINSDDIYDKSMIKVKAIQYLHNFKEDKNKFFINEYKYYCKYKSGFFVHDDRIALKQYLVENFDLSYDGSQVANLFKEGSYVIGSQGLKALEAIGRGKRNIEMRDEQKYGSEVISKVIDKFTIRPKNICIIVKGDAGTGKTYLGMEAILLAVEKESEITAYNCAFTMARNRTLKSVLDHEAGFEFPYLEGIEYEKNRYKLVVVDEAHRIKNVEKSIKGLFASDSIPKIVVFLQDDKQRVLLSDSGTFQKLSSIVTQLDIEVVELVLTTQQRSDSLGDFTKRIHKLLYNDNSYVGKESDFRVETNYPLNTIDSSLKKYINNGFSAKWYAPFNWEWQTREKYNVNYDIYINHCGEEFKKLWNPNCVKKQYDWYKGEKNEIYFINEGTTKHIDAIDQVGCVYTAQGLDYDYIGFIWCKDLYWDDCDNSWKYDLTRNKDSMLKKDLKKNLPKNATSKDTYQMTLEIILNRYYILLTRARKGIYIWFEDEATKRKFNSIMNVV